MAATADFEKLSRVCRVTVERDFGTMIVKPNHKRNSSRGSSGDWKRRSDVYEDRKFMRRYDDESEEEGQEEGFSTFVVKRGESDSVSGTVVRRSGGGGINVGFGGTKTMGRAVVSMMSI